MCVDVPWPKYRVARVCVCVVEHQSIYVFLNLSNKPFAAQMKNERAFRANAACCVLLVLVLGLVLDLVLDLVVFVSLVLSFFYFYLPWFF